MFRSGESGNDQCSRSPRSRIPSSPPRKLLDYDIAVRSMLHRHVEQLVQPDALWCCVPTSIRLRRPPTPPSSNIRPLVLTPDAVWFCLAQGFAQHVSLNAERLRDRFVRFSGRQKLVVERADFQLGREESLARGVRRILAASRRARRQAARPVAADFSTTGPTERAAFDIVVMDAFQAYFEYVMIAGCGIPSITLFGTRKIGVRYGSAPRCSANSSSRRGSMRYCQCSIRSSPPPKAEVDRAFWQSFFRYESGSGGSEMTGRIQLLFPYITRLEVGPLEARPAPSNDGSEIQLLDPNDAVERRRRRHTKVPIQTRSCAIGSRDCKRRKRARRRASGSPGTACRGRAWPISSGLASALVRPRSARPLRAPATLRGRALWRRAGRGQRRAATGVRVGGRVRMSCASPGWVAVAATRRTGRGAPPTPPVQVLRRCTLASSGLPR